MTLFGSILISKNTFSTRSPLLYRLKPHKPSHCICSAHLYLWACALSFLTTIVEIAHHQTETHPPPTFSSEGTLQHSMYGRSRRIHWLWLGRDFSSNSQVLMLVVMWLHGPTCGSWVAEWAHWEMCFVLALLYLMAGLWYNGALGTDMQKAPLPLLKEQGTLHLYLWLLCPF